MSVDNGLTKAWRNRAGDVMVTFREGGQGPFNFTVRLKRLTLPLPIYGLRAIWLPVAFYIAVENEFTGRWHRIHRGRWQS